MTPEETNELRTALPPMPTKPPTIEIPSPSVQKVKIIPKKESVRITLPPKPAGAQLLPEIPAMSLFIKRAMPESLPEIPAPELHSLVYDYVLSSEKAFRRQYGVNYIAFAYSRPEGRANLLPIAWHEDKATLQRLVEERYVPAHPDAEIHVNTIDGILYPDAFNRERRA